MTKEELKLSIKNVFTDRPFLSLVAAVLLAGLIYCVVIGLTLQSRDIQVYTRYTAFGEAHFYKNYWYYLVGFLGFGIVVTLGHTALMVKMHSLDRRHSAFVVGTAALVVLLLGSAYGLSIMGLAFR